MAAEADASPPPKLGEDVIRNIAVLARRILAVIPLLSGFRLHPGDAIAERTECEEVEWSDSNGRR